MKIIRSVVVTSAAAALVLVPVAAQADAKSHHDAAGDMGSVAYDPINHVITNSPSTPEPAATLGDIAKIKVSNTARGIKFVTRYRNLAKIGDGQRHELAIGTPKGLRYVFVDAGPGEWKGRAFMTKANLKTKVKCKIGGHIGYGHNKVVVKVPSSCLHHPKVVKVGVETFVAYGSKVYYDQAYAVGGSYTDLIAASPKIHR